ncbi:MAG: hypothetical protein O3A01_07435 [bacterium]|nr:hypothetical protein [bacterium]
MFRRISAENKESLDLVAVTQKWSETLETGSLPSAVFLALKEALPYMSQRGRLSAHAIASLQNRAQEVKKKGFQLPCLDGLSRGESILCPIFSEPPVFQEGKTSVLWVVASRSGSNIVLEPTSKDGIYSLYDESSNGLSYEDPYKRELFGIIKIQASKGKQPETTLFDLSTYDLRSETPFVNILHNMYSTQMAKNTQIGDPSDSAITFKTFREMDASQRYALTLHQLVGLMETTPLKRGDVLTQQIQSIRYNLRALLIPTGPTYKNATELEANFVSLRASLNQLIENTPNLDGTLKTLLTQILTQLNDHRWFDSNCFEQVPHPTKMIEIMFASGKVKSIADVLRQPARTGNTLMLCNATPAQLDTIFHFLDLKSADPTCHFNWSQINIIALNKCNLEDLPPRLFHATNLLQLVLKANEIKVLPDEICTFKQLRVLEIHQNPLNTIPDALDAHFVTQYLNEDVYDPADGIPEHLNPRFLYGGKGSTLHNSISQNLYDLSNRHNFGD